VVRDGAARPIVHRMVDYQRLAGIEVKASATLSGNDVRGLQALAAAVGKKWVRGVVLYTGAEVIPFANNLHGIPVTHLWAG
jgi:hypothetical protein